MKIVYKPSGRAGEYAGLALNLFNGCTHGCKYCYCPGVRKTTSNDFYSSSKPKSDIIKKLTEDAIYLKNNFGDDCPEILLSFMGDVYQPEESNLNITREAINILIDHNLPFTILTKGGQRAIRDFDLLEKYPKVSFGTTLIFNKEDDAHQWEPNAATVNDRITTIMDAHFRGIKTWVSMEPVIDTKQALSLVDELHNFVDHWKVGKINYNSEIARQTDWLRFREDIKDRFALYGITDFYLKKSLTEL